ncbi:hypothetical protein K8352_12560 [Flavobacteriaceae bacterium F89]|uniref:Uncharacterized protein n=1 Tax=Cerina litoralis TaxID=2874477 RepID=A0AAE3EWE3_9FLAO|nr:hypothetical protein [Cerina litoralis]MCG2461584.1 hypothetical protein [Cerina litoralis]
MKTSVKTKVQRKQIRTSIGSTPLKIFGLCLILIFYGCKDAKTTKDGPIEKVNAVTAANDNVVEVVTHVMDLEVVPKIPSGWTTFRYKNKSEDTHFFVLEKLPEGKTLADSKAEVIPVFKEGMDLFNVGKTEEGLAAFDNLPPWFFKVVFNGGIGLVSPKGVAETTVNMSPGTYVLECYVKMPNGEFHSAHGMVSQLEVTDARNGNVQPKGDVDVSVSSIGGIRIKNKISAGNHVFAVHFEDQKAYENFLGHDVHLVRLNAEANLDELNAWMNWSDPNAFKTPAPTGVTFLGGIQEMPAGSTGYFKEDLSPGNYALISEVPNPRGKNMLVKFLVE